MSIEQRIFEHYCFSEEKLRAYGFLPDGEKLVFTKSLPQEELCIRLEYDGSLRGTIRDTTAEEEYTNFRIESSTGFSAEVRACFVQLLEDIRTHCCKNLFYRSEQGRRIYAYIEETYGGKPEFLWDKWPSFAAYRETKSQKWYAVTGCVPFCKLCRTSADTREVEVINLKVDPKTLPAYSEQRGFYPAYHMNKRHWISVCLDDTVSDAQIRTMIDYSYQSL